MQWHHLPQHLQVLVVVAASAVDAAQPRCTRSPCCRCLSHPGQENHAPHRRTSCLVSLVTVVLVLVAAAAVLLPIPLRTHHLQRHRDERMQPLQLDELQA